MTKCLYCTEEKPNSEWTLEHTIPRFLGGAAAPDSFKINNVCASCNHKLGLYVDGAFARTWWVSNWLASAARACYDPANPIGVPLVCIGPLALSPPGIGNDELCELWLGPHGELVYWIRPKDEYLFWYVGGHPVTTKKQESTAYFYFNENSYRDTTMTWVSFRDAFKDMKRVRKVMLTDVEGEDPATIGFKPRTDLDIERREYFSAQSISRDAKSSIPIYLPYDFRFMCKLALGVGYGIFGDRLLASPYAAELRNGVWWQQGKPEPEVHGSSHLAAQNPQFNQMMGRPHAVVIALNYLRDGVTINLNICRQLNYTIRCTAADVYDTPPRRVDEGQALVIYPFLNRCIQLRFSELIAQFTRTTHPEIREIENRFRR